MDTSNHSIAAYDPGLVTGCAELSAFDDWSFSELSKEDFIGDMSPFSNIAVCETSSGKDGLLSAYMRGIIEGRGEYYQWFEQSPAERRRFLPLAEKITSVWFSKYNHKKSDHIIDACAHLLCFLWKHDIERYNKVTKGVK